MRWYVTVLALGFVPMAGAQTCAPHWSTAGGTPGFVGSVWALAEFAGEFYAGGAIAHHLAKWQGANWGAVGGGLNDRVNALLAWETPASSGLFVGGSFTVAGTTPASRIAFWDGTTWSSVGAGVGGQSPVVFALCAYDEGSGNTLFAGGEFTSAGASAAKNVARWNGAFWSPLGAVYGGPTGYAAALTVFDDGAGPALYVGGWLPGLTKWDGADWAAVGGNLGPQVYALTTFDNGSGPALYVGGNFAMAGSTLVNNIAKWDGFGWTALGSGLNNEVYTLTTFDDGTGPGLYAGGAFTHSGITFLNHVGRWERGWSVLAGGANANIYALLSVDESLTIGGTFTAVGCGQAAGAIAHWMPCPECYADCNADRLLTVADFACFQARYVGGDPWANCNGDCGLSVADFGCFQSAFVFGCP